MSKGNSKPKCLNWFCLRLYQQFDDHHCVWRVGSLKYSFHGCDDEKQEKYKREQELQFQLDTLYFQALFYRLQC